MRLLSKSSTWARAHESPDVARGRMFSIVRTPAASYKRHRAEAYVCAQSGRDAARAWADALSLSTTEVNVIVRKSAFGHVVKTCNEGGDVVRAWHVNVMWG